MARVTLTRKASQTVSHHRWLYLPDPLGATTELSPWPTVRGVRSPRDHHAKSYMTE